MIRDLHTPAVDVAALFDSVSQRLHDEADAMTEAVPHLDVDLDVDLDRDNEPVVKADWYLRLEGRSACLRDDLVEELLLAAARLMEGRSTSFTRPDMEIEFSVRKYQPKGAE